MNIYLKKIFFFDSKLNGRKLGFNTTLRIFSENCS